MNTLKQQQIISELKRPDKLVDFKSFPLHKEQVRKVIHDVHEVLFIAYFNVPKPKHITNKVLLTFALKYDDLIDTDYFPKRYKRDDLRELIKVAFEYYGLTEETTKQRR